MAQFDDTNKGALFTNDKGDNPKRPDYQGKLTIAVKDFTPDKNGLVVIQLSAWNNEAKSSGQKYLGLKASAPQT